MEIITVLSAKWCWFQRVEARNMLERGHVPADCLLVLLEHVAV